METTTLRAYYTFPSSLYESIGIIWFNIQLLNPIYRNCLLCDTTTGYANVAQICAISTR